MKKMLAYCLLISGSLAFTFFYLSSPGRADVVCQYTGPAFTDYPDATLGPTTLGTRLDVTVTLDDNLNELSWEIYTVDSNQNRVLDSGRSPYPNVPFLNQGQVTNWSFQYYFYIQNTEYEMLSDSTFLPYDDDIIQNVSGPGAIIVACAESSPAGQWTLETTTPEPPSLLLVIGLLLSFAGLSVVRKKWRPFFARGRTKRTA